MASDPASLSFPASSAFWPSPPVVLGPPSSSEDDAFLALFLDDPTQIKASQETEVSTLRLGSSGLGSSPVALTS